MGYVVQVVMTAALCWLCFKLGQKQAWNYIAENYIAIHKKCIIGRVFVQTNEDSKEEVKHEKRTKKNIAKRTHKKTSK